MDDIDLSAALDAAEEEAQALDSALTEVDTDEAVALLRANAAVRGFADMMAALASLPQLHLVTTDERQQAVALLNNLAPIAEAIDMHRRRLEMTFRRIAIEEGADRILLGDGRTVTYKLPQGRYETKADAMRAALLALVPRGLVTQDQVDEALPVTVTIGENHTKLNALATHNGDRVRDIIEANRRKVPGNPLAGTIVIPREVTK